MYNFLPHNLAQILLTRNIDFGGPLSLRQCAVLMVCAVTPAGGAASTQE